jgi:hypothetical protein
VNGLNDPIVLVLATAFALACAWAIVAIVRVRQQDRSSAGFEVKQNTDEESSVPARKDEKNHG